MWTRHQVKAIGKASMKANYFNSGAAALLLAFCTGALTAYTGNRTREQFQEVSGQGVPPEVASFILPIIIGVGTFVIICVLLDICLLNPLAAGCRRFFLRNLHEPASMGEIMVPIRSDFQRTVITMLLADIFKFLWTLLFLIPGIIKHYSYMLVPYLLQDHPELEPTEVITLSRRMMNGYKMQAFVLDLSFIGWHLLGAISCGLVDIFYTFPYVACTNAAVYEAIMRERGNGMQY